MPRSVGPQLQQFELTVPQMVSGGRHIAVIKVADLLKESGNIFRRRALCVVLDFRKQSNAVQNDQNCEHPISERRQLLNSARRCPPTLLSVNFAGPLIRSAPVPDQK